MVENGTLIVPVSIARGKMTLSWMSHKKHILTRECIVFAKQDHHQSVQFDSYRDDINQWSFNYYEFIHKRHLKKYVYPVIGTFTRS